MRSSSVTPSRRRQHGRVADQRIGGELLGHADHQAAGDGAVGLADAAQDGGGEHRQQHEPSHLGIDLRIDAEEDAAGARQHAAHDPHPHGDALGVDAAHLGQVGVVAQRPHRLAGLGAGEEQVQQEDQRHGDEDDVDVALGDSQALPDQGLLDASHVDLGQRRPDELDQRAHHQGDAERGDQQDHRRVLAQGPVK